MFVSFNVSLFMSLFQCVIQISIEMIGFYLKVKTINDFFFLTLVKHGQQCVKRSERITSVV